MKVLRRLLKFAALIGPGTWLLQRWCSQYRGLTLEPVVIKWVIDEILESKNYALLLYGALAILGVAIIRGVLQYFQRFSMSWAGQKWCSTYATLCTATFSGCHSVSTTKPKRAR